MFGSTKQKISQQTAFDGLFNFPRAQPYFLSFKHDCVLTKISDTNCIRGSMPFIPGVQLLHTNPGHFRRGILRFCSIFTIFPQKNAQNPTGGEHTTDNRKSRVCHKWRRKKLDCKNTNFQWPNITDELNSKSYVNRVSVTVGELCVRIPLRCQRWLSVRS